MPDGARADALDVTRDWLLGGRVSLLQSRRGHRVGTDTVLLARAAAEHPAGLAIDAGAGTGAVGLMIRALRPGTRVTFVEREAALAELCRRNAAENGAGDALVACADILDPESRRAAGLLAQSADLVATNPPFLDAARTRTSPDPVRAAAHTLGEGGIGAWIRACGALLKPGGRLVLIHRADALEGVLEGFARGFGGVTLRFVHPRRGEPAGRVLATAVAGSRGPLSIAPPLVVHGEDGGFTPEAAALHGGEGA